MPSIPVMTDGQLLIGKTGFAPVPALPTDTPSILWTGGAGTQIARLRILPNNTVSAVGTTQAGATEMDHALYNLFYVNVASAGQVAIKFKASTKRVTGYIINATAVTLSVFPESGGSINFGATNAAVSLATARAYRYYSRVSGHWIVELLS